MLVANHVYFVGIVDNTGSDLISVLTPFRTSWSQNTYKTVKMAIKVICDEGSNQVKKAKQSHCWVCLENVQRGWGREKESGSREEGQINGESV